MSLSRDFKGIWIPKEIWLHPELSLQAKALWAEIHSLYSKSHSGCYASEEYLCSFMGLKRSQFYETLAQLKKLNLVIDVSYDGRIKVRKALMPPEDTGQQESDAGQQESGKPDYRVPENRTTESDIPNAVPIYTEIKDLEKRKGVPTKPKIEKIPYREYVLLTEAEHNNILAKYGEDKVKRMLDKLNVYKESKGVKYESDYALFKEGSWLLTAIEETLPSKAPKHTVEDNGKWARRIERLSGNGWKLCACSSYLEFNHGTFSERIPYEKENFREQVKEELKRKGINYTEEKP